MSNRTLENGFSGIVVEDANRVADKGDKLELNVYACPVDAAPIKLSNDQFTVAEGTGYTYANGIVTITDDATSPVTVGVSAFDGKYFAALNVELVK